MQARTRQMWLFVAVAVTLVVVLAATTLAQSGNPTNLGTWKLNLAKSKISADMAPKSATFTVEAAGAGAKVTVDAVYADGTVRHWGYTANYDGKDNPITGNCQYGDVAAVTRVDANTTKNIYKMGGKVTVTQVAVVSGDGKMETITSTGTNALGQSVNTVGVWDKQ